MTRMAPSAPLALSLALLAAGMVQAQTPMPAAPAEGQTERPVRVRADHPGRIVFERQCAPCHGAGPGDDGMAMLPGTMALAQRYKGQLPAALELRDDLTVEALSYFVRNGIGAMPMFRKSELTDADIAVIAGYLAQTSAANR